jgi:hypothetical protein
MYARIVENTGQEKVFDVNIRHKKDYQFKANVYLGPDFNLYIRPVKSKNFIRIKPSELESVEMDEKDRLTMLLKECECFVTVADGGSNVLQCLRYTIIPYVNN